MTYADAHNHLQDGRFLGRQGELVDAATGAGVTAMVVNGSCEEDWADVERLWRMRPDVVIPSFGLHPWYVHQRTERWHVTLEGLLDRMPAAVGEAGLDRWKPGLPWEDQVDVCAMQVRTAAARNLPLSLHCLQAWGALVELLEREPVPDCGFLLHSFGGSLDVAGRLARRGAYFSIPGYFAHERKERQREVFRRIQLDRLLVETDAPDQLPPARWITHPLGDEDGGPLNHPANLAAVYAFAAELRGMDAAEFAALVAGNFRRLFGRVMPDG